MPFYFEDALADAGEYGAGRCGSVLDLWHVAEPRGLHCAKVLVLGSHVQLPRAAVGQCEVEPLSHVVRDVHLGAM